jgi:hypothetical protein
MATPGFTALPSTEHFTFEFNDLLNVAASTALGKALADTAERDYNTMTFWFSGAEPQGGPILTKINQGSGGASNDNLNNINLRLGATSDFDAARFTLVAEVMEIFMATNKFGWKPGDSSGEGLSQLGAFTLYPSQIDSLNGPQVWLDTSVGSTPDKPSRPNFVSKPEPFDGNFVSFGCALLFLYNLRTQLGFSMKATISAHAGSLEDVYFNLTKDRTGLQEFTDTLAAKFPPGVPCDLVGSRDPFPLPTDRVLSARRFMANSETDPAGLGLMIRANRELGNLRALLNSNRPVSRIR